MLYMLGDNNILPNMQSVKYILFMCCTVEVE